MTGLEVSFTLTAARWTYDLYTRSLTPLEDRDCGSNYIRNIQLRPFLYPLWCHVQWKPCWYTRTDEHGAPDRRTSPLRELALEVRQT